MTPKAMLADLRRWGVGTGTIAANLLCSPSTVRKLEKMDPSTGSGPHVSADILGRLERTWRRYRTVSGAREAT